MKAKEGRKAEEKRKEGEGRKEAKEGRKAKALLELLGFVLFPEIAHVVAVHVVVRWVLKEVGVQCVRAGSGVNRGDRGHKE